MGLSIKCKKTGTTNNTVEEFNAMLREMGETELLEDPKDFVIVNQKQK